MLLNCKSELEVLKAVILQMNIVLKQFDLSIATFEVKDLNRMLFESDTVNRPLGPRTYTPNKLIDGSTDKTSVCYTDSHGYSNIFGMISILFVNKVTVETRGVTHVVNGCSHVQSEIPLDANTNATYVQLYISLITTLNANAPKSVNRSSKSVFEQKSAIVKNSNSRQYSTKRTSTKYSTLSTEFPQFPYYVDYKDGKIMHRV